MGRDPEAVQRLSEALRDLTSTAAEGRLYPALAELFEDKDWFDRALALSKSAERTPNDSGKQFRIGYAYAQAGYEDLALLHYEATLDIDSAEASAMNNRGVAHERLDLPIRSVRDYRRAVELGNTLGDANLALKHMNAGFVNDAREILTTALAKENPHPNVAANLARLAELEEDESERERTIASTARTKDSFFRGYAAARFVASAPSLEGDWMFADGTAVTVREEGANIEVSWTWEQKPNRLVGPRRNRAIVVRHEVQEKRVYGEVWERKSSGFAFARNDEHIEVLLNADVSVGVETLDLRRATP